jgi:hypothetical protein
VLSQHLELAQGVLRRQIGGALHDLQEAERLAPARKPGSTTPVAPLHAISSSCPARDQARALRPR